MSMGDVGEIGDVPENCDCCGRDAEDCGMADEGWVHEPGLSDGAADFCRGCAHLLRIARLSEHCSWCGAGLEDEESGGWAYFADEIGAFHACCPGCLEQRFGITARANKH
jgi:hypothetical protein